MTTGRTDGEAIEATGAPAPDAGESPTRYHEFAWRTHYGFLRHDVTLPSMASYGRALLVIVGADGVVSDAEWQYFVDLHRALGWPPSREQLEEFRRFDYRSARIEDLAADFDPLQARMLLYDAVRMSAADGYDEAERAMAARFAALLRVPAETLAALESLVEREAALLAEKGRVIKGDG